MAKSKSTKTKKVAGKIQNDERTSSQVTHPHPSATREDIRTTDHRTMGSRQSRKPAERSNQRRQPKTGGAGGHGLAGKADRSSST